MSRIFQLIQDQTVDGKLARPAKHRPFLLRQPSPDRRRLVCISPPSQGVPEIADGPASSRGQNAEHRRICRFVSSMVEKVVSCSYSPTLEGITTARVFQ